MWAFFKSKFKSKEQTQGPLPEEMLLHVFSFLKKPSDLAHAAQVTHLWNRVSETDSLWAQFGVQSKNMFIGQKKAKQALQEANLHQQALAAYFICQMPEQHKKVIVHLIGKDSSCKDGIFNLKTDALFNFALEHSFFGVRSIDVNAAQTYRILMSNTPSQGRFKKIIQDQLIVANMVLACVSRKEEIAEYSEMVANCSKSDVLLLFVTDQANKVLLEKDVPTLLVMQPNDTLLSFFSRVMQKVEIMAASILPPSAQSEPSISKNCLII